MVRYLEKGIDRIVSVGWAYHLTELVLLLDGILTRSSFAEQKADNW